MKIDTISRTRLYLWRGLVVIVPVLIFFGLSNTASAQSVNLDIPSLVQAVNQDRIVAGLAPLRRDETLEQAATLKAQDMLLYGYFAHNSPSGIEPWHWFRMAGYDYILAGENLALDFNDSTAVEAAWMASPKHRENLLNPEYEEVGYAIAYGKFTNINGVAKEREGTIIVQFFGKRLPAVFAESPTTSAAPPAPAQTIVVPAPMPAAPSIQITLTPNPLTTITLPRQSALIYTKTITEPITSPKSPIIQSAEEDGSGGILSFNKAINELSGKFLTSDLTLRLPEPQNNSFEGPSEVASAKAKEEETTPLATWPIMSVALFSLMVTAGFHSRFVI